MTNAPALSLLEGAILSYFIAINTIYLVFTVIAFFDLLAYRRRIGRDEGRPLLSDGAYPPISILVPAHNEVETVVDNIRSLLLLGYPEFEVVLINDGSQDATMERLKQSFDLYPAAVTPDQRLPTRPLKQTYLSADHPNLTVLDKVHGGKSDALNTMTFSQLIRH